MAKNGEWREFLSTRRARVQPEDVGIETGGKRRAPGLRREEVAMLAGVSLDYYARLEQGRDLQPSDQVLDGIARALRLADVERLYLHNLVRSSVAAPKPDDLELGPLDAGMRLLLDSLEIPGLIIDIRGNVHAMNRIGRAMLVGLEPMPSTAASHPRWLFLEPSTRDLFTDWEMIARVSVGVLREAADRYPRDKELHALIGELSDASPEFRSRWAEHDVDARRHGLKRFHHPVVGELIMHVEALQLQDGERWLYAYAVEPGSPVTWHVGRDAGRRGDGRPGPDPALHPVHVLTDHEVDSRRAAGDSDDPKSNSCGLDAWLAAIVRDHQSARSFQRTLAEEQTSSCRASFKPARPSRSW